MNIPGHTLCVWLLTQQIFGSFVVLVGAIGYKPEFKHFEFMTFSMFLDMSSLLIHAGALTNVYGSDFVVWSPHMCRQPTTVA